jgi:hypothetical protein
LVAISTRSLWALFALGAVVAALAGYALGGRAKTVSGSVHAPPPAAQQQQQQLSQSLAASVLLESPRGWQAAPAAPAIPGLQLTRAIAFAPGGDAAQAGLLTGLAAAGEPAPLPGSLLARLGAPPAAEVVVLPQSEAFRYTGLAPSGYDRRLTVYAIPNPGGNPTILACYAPAAQASFMRACEGVVTTLRPVGQTTSTPLKPEAEYGARVSAAIRALDRQRTALRRKMAAGTPEGTVGALATRMSARFAHAAAALAAIEPPLVAGQAQAAVVRSLIGARDAYRALATAAANGGASGYEAARAQVEAAEAGVGRALEGFALIGYHP